MLYTHVRNFRMSFKKCKFIMDLVNIGRLGGSCSYCSEAKLVFGRRFFVSRNENMGTQVEFNSEVLHYNSPHELDVEDDEVYRISYRISGGPGSIQDIWKKFELIPSPPLSPSRQAASSGHPSPNCLTTASASIADTLQTVSDILDIDTSRTTLLFPDTSCPNLKSKLIQDCMWGGHSATVEKAQHFQSIYDTPCSTPPTLDYASADCVDPSSVFPYPINNQDFASDSSEDEGEIDVVTIEKPVKRKASIPVVECTTDNENFDEDEEDDDDDDEEIVTNDEPPVKKLKSMHKKFRVPKETQEADRDQMSCRFEDPECKRTVHNVLERKRRNDLKSSFQVLRDSVPELKGSERAPKVSILKKATDCIVKLKIEDENLAKQRELLEKKHQTLLRKLKSLQETSK